MDFNLTDWSSTIDFVCSSMMTMVYLKHSSVCIHHIYKKEWLNAFQGDKLES